MSSAANYSSNLYLSFFLTPKRIHANKIHQFPLSALDFRQFLDESTSEFKTSSRKLVILDMNPTHYGEYINSFQEELNKRNIKLFYIPPESSHLNLTSWFFQQLQFQL